MSFLSLILTPSHETPWTDWVGLVNMRNRPVSCTLVALLLYLLLPWVFDLSSFDDELWCGPVSKLTTFLFKLSLVMVFQRRNWNPKTLCTQWIVPIHSCQAKQIYLYVDTLCKHVLFLFILSIWLVTNYGIFFLLTFLSFFVYISYVLDSYILL